MTDPSATTEPTAATNNATPPSIRRFTRLWFAATGFWMVGRTLAWERTQHQLERNPSAAEVAGWAQPAMVALVLAMTLMQWWLVTRRASTVGKWLVLIVAAFGALRGLLLLREIVVHPLSTGSLLLSAGLSIWAAAMLLRDDARVWFGDVGEPDE